MSVTICYPSLSIEECIKVLNGRNSNFENGLLSWDDEERNGNKRYGVYLTQVEPRTERENSVLYIDKGHTTVWNGQNQLTVYLKEAGHNMSWTI